MYLETWFYGHQWYVRKKTLMGVDIWNYAKVWPFYHFCLVFFIINFYNLSYIFNLHHCSAICWDFILRLISLDMSITFLFVSVIMLFVYDSDWFGTAATSVKELFMITFYGFQSLLFLIGRFVWYVLAVPDPPLALYFFTVNNVIICSEVSFS